MGKINESFVKDLIRAKNINGIEELKEKLENTEIQKHIASKECDKCGITLEVYHASILEAIEQLEEDEEDECFGIDIEYDEDEEYDEEGISNWD